MAATVTLSSVGTSGGLILDYIGAKTTTAVVTLASTTMTVNAIVQATLDSSAASGGTPTWYSVSSIAVTSAYSDSGYVASILTPIAGLRLSSTAISSSSLTLKALQNAGG
jgi:hypothetical protein